MKTTVLKERILTGKLDSRLLDIYLDESLLDYQRDRYVKALEKYEEIYGENDVCIISVPGRSEVGGNHTDHQHGKVIACSINLDIIGVVSKAKNIMINSDGRKVFVKMDELDKIPSEERSTKALVKGVVNRLDQLFYRIGGFSAYCTSDVLVGSGMSSSAAFEVLIGNIISYLYNRNEIDPVEIAKVSQYAENVYFGKPSGLMDQMACSVGSLVNIDFENVNKPLIHKVNVDFSEFGHSLCIVDTKGSHASLTDEYAAIPNEMKKVAEFFNKKFIREVSYEEIISNISALREQCGDRAVLRSLHIIEENIRVDEEVKCLEEKNFDGFLKLIKASGDSSYKYLQNIYSNKNIDQQPVSLALMVSEHILQGKGACRVHGGGFAGTIQAFVPNDFVQTYKQEIERVFGDGSCHVLKISKYGGLAVIA